MKSDPEGLSQRLLRKGAFVEETFRLFANWQPGQPLDQVLEETLHGACRTIAWANEVSTTLRRRFRQTDANDALVAAARSGLPLEEWRSCLLLWIGGHELLYREFALEWLYPEYMQGRLFVRADDVCPLVRDLSKLSTKNQKAWTDYGVLRTARDLLRMASDFHILVGRGSVKHFRSVHLSDRCFLYFAHAIAAVEGSPARVPASRLWRLVLMSPTDVEHELLRLHQYRQLDYHVAGSLVQLSLPYASASEYAERMAA